MFTSFSTLVLVAAVLFGPVQPAADHAVFMPLLVSTTVPTVEEVVWNQPPGVWIHVIKEHPDTVVSMRAVIFNPDHPDGYWTPWATVPREQWFSVYYRLEWPDSPSWMPPEMWQQIMVESPDYESPDYWHEQRIIQFRGRNYRIETLPIEPEAN